ncbi:hypothetical protein M2150_001690 [Lachnospiraceae bacterium PM6-15]|uniref:hypothetical protein n=1 Tax=Ohessyouella blattaphilus TaxID=2949333 RepID=UPI003E1CAE67
MNKIKLEEMGNYTLFAKLDKDTGVSEYVIANQYDKETDSWAHGTYISELSSALKVFYEKAMQNMDIKVEGHRGKWYSIDTMFDKDGEMLFLMEHSTYGDEAPGIIIDKDFNLIAEDIWNGFDDLEDNRIPQKDNKINQTTKKKEKGAR